DDGVPCSSESTGPADPPDLVLYRGLGFDAGAHHSHPAGYPISQRENAGFNWPGFAVSAEEPFGAGPEAAQTCRPDQLANFTACSRLAVCFFPSIVRPVASIFSIDI